MGCPGPCQSQLLPCPGWLGASLFLSSTCRIIDDAPAPSCRSCHPPSSPAAGGSSGLAARTRIITPQQCSSSTATAAALTGGILDNTKSNSLCNQAATVECVRGMRAFKWLVCCYVAGGRRTCMHDGFIDSSLPMPDQPT